MIQVSVTQARQQLPQLLNRVFAGEEFLVVKNKIPVATISPVKREKAVIKKRLIPGATKLMSHLRGDSVDIVNEWRKREEARSYHYGR